MGVKIITDSTSDLTIQEAEALGVKIVPLKVNFGSEEFIDKFTISNEEFFDRLGKTDVMPTTTLVNVGEFIVAFNESPDDEIVCILLAASFSGTLQSAVIAKENVARDNIYIVDSETVSVSLWALVQVAVKMRDAGKNAKEIVAAIDELKKKIVLLSVFDTLKYLVKGGRLSGVAGFVGELIKLKPIVRVKNSKVENIGKTRGIKAGMEFILKTMEEDFQLDESMPIYFGHTMAAEDAEVLKARVAEKHPIIGGQLISIGSVVGTHAGSGAIAVVFFNK
ncbi:MAG: DegV family protein [Clostridia bacterium]